MFKSNLWNTIWCLCWSYLSATSREYIECIVGHLLGPFIRRRKERSRQKKMFKSNLWNTIWCLCWSYLSATSKEYIECIVGHLLPTDRKWEQKWWSALI
jgi:amino acid permease